MIIKDHASPQHDGVIQENNFKIKTTSKAFSILSNGLYSDKIKSIIRELSCNAWDSHVAANKKNVPFIIHLPNNTSPYFSVKDFGVGLNHEQIMNLYTTYFESTKTSSNDYIGALGLGSKSPFAYTESFTIISNYKGYSRTYTAFINEQEIPTIVLMDEKQTNESNGLEIKFSVNQKDINDFINKSKIILKRFNSPKPKIIGSNDYVLPEVKCYFSEKSWYLLSEKSMYNSPLPVTIQGNIEYPIKAESLNELDVYQTAVLGLPIEIEFNIGDLDVAASRRIFIIYNTNTK